MFKANEEIKKDALIALLDIVHIQKETASLGKIKNYVEKIRNEKIDEQDIMQALFELIIEHKIESHKLEDNTDKYTLKITRTYEVIALYEEKYGVPFSSVVNIEPDVELENEMLIKIYERNFLKKRDCDFKNVARPLAKNTQDVDEFYTHAKEVMFNLVIQKRVIVHTNQFSTFELNPEIIPEIKNLYDKTIKDRYDDLTQPQKELLRKICWNVQHDRAFFLNKLDDYDYCTTMHDFEILREKGFALQKNTFYYYGKLKQGENLVPTFFGITACQRFKNQKQKQEQYERF